MAWIENDELDLLDLVFEPKSLIPTNRKGGLKLRHISFFYTNMKAITNVCKTLEKASMGVDLQHQYAEVLRKLGLLNKDRELTKYGKMLLQIIYYDDHKIMQELIQQDITIDSISEEIPFIIEFFLFCVVRKCMENPEACEAEGISIKDIDTDSMNNLMYFFDNVIDTLNEPTNKNNDLSDLFSFDNDDFYYTLQGMNFTGYEIKRLIRSPRDQINRICNIYLRLLGEVRRVDVNDLSNRERQYYEYAEYYTNLVQRDVRNRVKHSVLNYILYDSIVCQRDKIKLVKRAKYEAIIPYEKIKEIYGKYNLADIYNLVFFDKNSKYIVNQIKKLGVSDEEIDLIDENRVIKIPSASFSKYKINIGDSVLFVNLEETRLLCPNIYSITKIQEESDGIMLYVDRKEAVNMDRADEILKSVKG